MFLIRSMTTTDFDYRSGAKVVPYHIYLREPHRRAGAYWAHKGEAQRFATVEEALAEANRVLPDRDSRFEIVPVDDEGFVPHYWQSHGMPFPHIWR